MAQGESSAVLKEGDTCWRIAHADRFALIIDAAAYFAAAKEAMLEARHSILLIAWDFDLRIRLTQDGDGFDGTGDELGAFLKAILRRRPNLRIYILKWDMALMYTLAGQVLPIAELKWASARRLKLRFDSVHPWMSAHHQKIVVIDDAIAFCGGIDMTTDRWDTRQHLPDDERRVRPSAEPYGPWHDATCAVDGEAARALGELARWRWKLATGERIEAPHESRAIWPGCLQPNVRDIDVAIARTMPLYNGRGGIREIEALYLAAINSAKRLIYLESQYLASIRICEAIAERLRDPEGPEVVVINPDTAEGWLEEETMDVARAICVRTLREADAHGRFGIYYPVNSAGEPIYVHAKILIVDDRILRVGSSNINNRSLGFDSECDLAIEAPADAPSTIRDAIRAVRMDLLAEHLGAEAARVAAEVEKHGMHKVIRTLSREHGPGLKPVVTDPPNAAEEALLRSRLADPERPRDLESRLAHLAKLLAFRIPPGALIGGLGLIGLGVALAYRLRRGRSDRALIRAR